MLNTAEAKCQRHAVRVMLFGKCSRLDAISSYISINWSKLPGDSGKGSSLVMRCEARSSSFLYKELRTVFLILPFWSEEILFSLRHFSSLYIFFLASFFWSNEDGPNLTSLKVFLDLQWGAHVGEAAEKGQGRK